MTIFLNHRDLGVTGGVSGHDRYDAGKQTVTQTNMTEKLYSQTHQLEMGDRF